MKENQKKKFAIRNEGEPFRPVLNCKSCGVLRSHDFVRSQEATMMHYERGGLTSPVPRLDKDGKPNQMTADIWACSDCQTERVYGSA